MAWRKNQLSQLGPIVAAEATIFMIKALIRKFARKRPGCKWLQAVDGPANGTNYELSLAVPIITLKRHFIENHLNPF